MWPRAGLREARLAAQPGEGGSVHSKYSRDGQAVARDEQDCACALRALSLPAGCGEAEQVGASTRRCRAVERRAVEGARLEQGTVSWPCRAGMAALHPHPTEASVGGNSIVRGQALGMATTTKAVEGGDRAR